MATTTDKLIQSLISYPPERYSPLVRSQTAIVRNRAARFKQERLRWACARLPVFARRADWAARLSADWRLITTQPRASWIRQIARNVADPLDGFLLDAPRWNADVLLPHCCVTELSIFFGHRPRTIDCPALIVRPKQPYVDWANSMDDGGPRTALRKLREEPSIYLVEDIDLLEDLTELIAEC